MKARLILFFLILFCNAEIYAQRTLLFIGSYTGGRPDTGIYIYDFNTHTGQLKKLSAVDPISNPSFLTLAPNGQFLYACTESKTPNAGSITAFKIDSIHGRLTLLNKQPAGGENPVYVSVHKNNRYVINAGYTEGTVSVFRVNNDGSLQPYIQNMRFEGSSVIKSRQDKAYLHAAVFSPDRNYVFFTDLGADRIRAFSFDSTQTQPLKEEKQLEVTTVPGSGPRHLTFHPSGKFSYCIEETGGTISVYSYLNGKLDPIQRILSHKNKEYESADIHLSPDGLFLYASNRGTENSLSIFSVSQQSGKLMLLGHQFTHGKHPRNFTIDPTGNFLLVANVTSNDVIVFKRNKKTGLLTKLKGSLSIYNPSCLQMRTYNTGTQHD